MTAPPLRLYCTALAKHVIENTSQQSLVGIGDEIWQVASLNGDVTGRCGTCQTRRTVLQLPQQRHLAEFETSRAFLSVYQQHKVFAEDGES
jgi:hypothetical protein